MFCGGLELTPTTRLLHASSRRRKFLLPSILACTLLFFIFSVLLIHLVTFSEMDAGRQRVLVRKSATTRKQQRETSMSIPKEVLKAAFKRKNDVKDNRPSKNGMGSSVGD